MFFRILMTIWAVCCASIWLAAARDWTSVLVCLVVTVVPTVYLIVTERQSRLRH